MRPLYVVGTQRNVGKTTTCIGLIGALRERGLKVGYMKPLGQRVTTIHGESFDDDTLAVVHGMELGSSEVPMAVPLPRGRVEQEVKHLINADALAEKVRKTFEALQAKHDIVIVEASNAVISEARTSPLKTSKFPPTIEITSFSNTVVLNLPRIVAF